MRPWKKVRSLYDTRLRIILILAKALTFGCVHVTGVEDNPATQSEENTSIVQTNHNSNRSRVQAPRTKKKQPINNKKLKKRAISSSEEDASTDSSSD
jgi:hypothetical protein